MGKIIELKNHSSLRFVDTVKQISAPLNKINIDYFCLVRTFKNRSRICLTTSGEWHEHFCNEKQYIKDVFELPIDNYENGYFLASTTANDVIHADLQYNFNIRPIVAIIEKNENFCDFYHFGTTASNKDFVDVKSYLAELDSFILLFRDKARILFKKSQLIIFPEWNSNEKNFHREQMEQAKNIKNLISPKRYVFDDGDIRAYLTHMELECIKLIALGGKSAEEIGMIFGISKRTVQAHIENMKKKFNCVRLPQLVYKLSESRLFHRLIHGFIE